MNRWAKLLAVGLALFATTGYYKPRRTGNLPRVAVQTYGVAFDGAEYFVPTFPSTTDWDYVQSKGIKLVRLVIAWEDLQPTLSAALNTTYLASIKTAVAAASARGIRVIIDLHNFGGYVSSAAWGSSINTVGNGGVPAAGVNFLGDGTLTSAQFVDLWTRIATAFVGNPGLAGYEIMNEPSIAIVGTNMVDAPNFFGATNPTNWAPSGTSVWSQLGAGSNPLGANYGPAWTVTNTGGFAGQSQSLTFAAVPYTISLYAKTTVGTVPLRLQIAPNQSADLTVTTSWQRFSFTNTPSAGLTNINFYINSATTTLTLQIANVQVELGSSATTYVPNKWVPFAQAAITAIGAIDSVTPIYVNGITNTQPAVWTQRNYEMNQLTGTNIIFNTHAYFDGAQNIGNGGVYTGTYSSYSIDTQSGVGAMSSFVNWANAYNLKTIVGEFDVPSWGQSTSANVATNVLTTNGTITGTFDVGQQISGPGITAGPNSVIASLGTGTGRNVGGTYNLVGSPGNVSGVAVAGVITSSSPWYTLQGNFETYLNSNAITGWMWSYGSNGFQTKGYFNVAPQSGVDDARLTQMLAIGFR